MKLVALKDLYFLSAIALIEVAALFPSHRLKELVARTLASTAYRFSMTKRRTIEKNLSRAFAGKLGGEQRRRIVKGALSGVWREMLSWSPSTKEAAAARGAKIHGVEHLHRALKEGKGVILWESNGFGRRLLAKQILRANGFAVHQVHGPNHLGGFLTEDSSATWVRRRMVKRFFTGCEKHFVTEIIDLPGSDSLAFTRILLNLLNRNAALCISGDGRVGQKLIPIDFLAGTTSSPRAWSAWRGYPAHLSCRYSRPGGR